MSSNDSMDSVLLTRLITRKEGAILAEECSKLKYPLRFIHNLRQSLTIKGLLNLSKCTKTSIRFVDSITPEQVKACINIARKQKYILSMNLLKDFYLELPEDVWFLRIDVSDEKTKYKHYYILDTLFNLGKLKRKESDKDKYSYYKSPGKSFSVEEEWISDKEEKVYRSLMGIYNKKAAGVPDVLLNYLKESSAPYYFRLRTLLLDKGYVLQDKSAKVTKWNTNKIPMPTKTLCREILKEVRGRKKTKVSITPILEEKRGVELKQEKSIGTEDILSFIYKLYKEKNIPFDKLKELSEDYLDKSGLKEDFKKFYSNKELGF